MGGLMHWWGLTIDTVSSLSLILAIGLSVDYSAHVGHMFMTLTGTREERSKATLTAIGPAVFHGGFSTFLAFSLLAGTDSHVFGTFFKVTIRPNSLCLFHCIF
jgi:predicted RND superfamily exporter protein